MKKLKDIRQAMRESKLLMFAAGVITFCLAYGLVFGLFDPETILSDLKMGVRLVGPVLVVMVPLLLIVLRLGRKRE